MLVTSAPGAGAVAISAPSTYSRTMPPSQVIARWVHCVSPSAGGPEAVSAERS